MTPHDDALGALHALDPGMARELWVRVCFAAKDAGITADEWLEWCERGPNFDRLDAVTTYRNAKPRAGGVTASTLFMLAADAGWKPYKGGNGGAGVPIVTRSMPRASPAPEPEQPPTDPRPFWEACHAIDVHPYLTRKGIKPHGARANNVGGLVVAYYNAARELQTIQTIAPDGSKRFLAGARQKGSVAILGEPANSPVVIVAEGFATAAAIEEATGFPVLASGSRGTMPEAARIARQFAPQARVVLAADRGDLSTPIAAARGVAGFLAVPGAEDSPDGFDFADWHLSGATDAEIESRIEHASPCPALEEPNEPRPPKVPAAKAVARAEPAPPAPPPGAADAAPYLTDGKGRIVANLANVFACLKTGALGEIRLDEFTGMVTWAGLPVEDVTYASITRALQRSVVGGSMPFMKLAVTLVVEVVNELASANAYNSCTDWLRTLTWDGIERVPQFFADVCSLDGTDYVHAVGRYFWLGMVGRMVHPGLKVDSAVALVGPQGIGKSSLVQLIGGERYGEAGLATIGEKDWLAQLRGKIVVEIAELAGAQRAELEQVKAILTRTHDEYRSAYKRASKIVPRGCVFVATTNEPDFLLDQSGNRRWLPVQCAAPFALDTVRSMRDQYFAEAFAQVSAGLPPTWHVVPGAVEAQARHLARDPWLDALDDALRPITTGKLPERATNSSIYDALKIPAERRTGGGSGRRIHACMRALGYTADDWRIEGRRVRGFVLTDPPPAEQFDADEPS